MWLRTKSEFEFNITIPTPFVLMLSPRNGALQWIAREEYHLMPSVEASEFTDVYGNLCESDRFWQMASEIAAGQSAGYNQFSIEWIWL